jgi:glycosyltransferase involved in cell wall biosynthesis
VTEPIGQEERAGVAVSLLTGGTDRHYAYGLATALATEGANVELVGGSQIDCPEFHETPNLKFLKLRGSLRPDVSLFEKISRISKYYSRLVGYSATASPRIFHILWNNRFELFDRTLLMCYYRALGKKVVLTAHNVNMRRRDADDSALNRFTLRIQYRLANHIFVHTENMKREVMSVFGVPAARVTTVAYGINNAVPNTTLTSADARLALGIRDTEKVILFFGRIRPYKGLEYLVDAFGRLPRVGQDYRLVIAGRADKASAYWASVFEQIRKVEPNRGVLLNQEFIPDSKVELYFKAADVLVLPYRNIYQSGILFLALSIGLPVLASDVGSLKDELVEGRNGFVFKPEDSADLADTIERYFKSDLYAHLDQRRDEIKNDATRRNSWEAVARTTMEVYAELLDSSLS